MFRISSGFGVMACTDPEWGHWVQTPPPLPPWKVINYRVSKQNWSGFPEKSLLPSQQCPAIIGTLVKHHFNGVSLEGWWWPAYSGIWILSPHQLKKPVKVGPSLITFWIRACMRSYMHNVQVKCMLAFIH